MMEHSHDSKLKNNNNDSSPSHVASGLVNAKNSMKFSKRRKSFKSPQSSTIDTWLKKDSSSSKEDMQLHQSCSKLKNVKNVSTTYNNRDNKSGVKCNKNKEQSSSSSGRVINKEKCDVKKVFKKESSNVSSKSEIKIKSRALQEVDITDIEMLSRESIARKKFKNIISLPCTSSVDNRLNDIPISNTELKHNSGSSNSIKYNAKENIRTPTKQNRNPYDLRRSPRNLMSPGTSVRELFSHSSSGSTKCNAKENIVTPTKQDRSPENLRRSPRNQKSPVFTAGTSVRRLFSQSSSSSATKYNAKENIRTLTKQNGSPENLKRSPRNLKSPAFTAGTVRKLFSQSDGTNTSLKKNTEDNKLDRVDVKRKEGKVKSNKSNEMKESSKCNPKNDIEGSKKTNSSTSKNKCRVKHARKNDAAVSSTKQKKYSVDLKSPKRSTDTSASQNNKLSKWLTKDTTSKSQHTKQSNKSSKQSGSRESKTAHKPSTKYNQLDVKINSKTPKEQRKESSEKKSTSKKKKAMRTLDNYIKESLKDSNKRKFSRSESNESYEFPSFAKTTKKMKTSRTSDSFKKYGIAVPSVQEILKEKEDLAQYKNQVESFKDIDDTFFELPFSVKDLKSEQVIENILDCKHLSDSDIKEGFQKNLDYISAIFHGKEYSERHERFFEANARNYAFTVKDLCYNTSTIVFSFEQKEILMSMLKKEFDPDDMKTLYFFQVLLPELCLKLFMDTHNMTYDEAVKYLDTRPVVD